MENTEKVYNGSDSAKHELKEKASQINKEVKEAVPLSYVAAKETVEDIRELGSESASKLADAISSKINTIEKYIKASPMKALMIGAGTGLAVGLWASYSKKSNK